tara:strand:- start:3319 stop:3693 length:375 start_codon:yes stop_codon:yes gene_type:complete
MEIFHKIVLFSAIIILIITLIVIGSMLTSAKGSKTWPPIVPECPDYWSITGMDVSGNNTSKCVNVKNLGTCPPNNDDQHLEMDFNVSPFTGDQGTCNKYKWATKCGISWDGITYGVDNPCQTSS